MVALFGTFQTLGLWSELEQQQLCVDLFLQEIYTFEGGGHATFEN